MKENQTQTTTAIQKVNTSETHKQIADLALNRNQADEVKGGVIKHGAGTLTLGGASGTTAASVNGHVKVFDGATGNEI